VNVYEWANKLTALEMADELEKGPLIPRDSAAKMIRQQADRIAELEVYEKQMQKIKNRKDLLNFILEKE